MFLKPNLQICLHAANTLLSGWTNTGQGSPAPGPTQQVSYCQINIQPLTPEVAARYNAHSTFNLGDTSIDLFCVEAQVIKAGSTAQIPLGIKCSAWDESGLNVSWMIIPSADIVTTPLRVCNAVEVIQAGSRDEICLAVDNIKDVDYTIHPGDRLCCASSINGRPLAFRVVQDHPETVPMYFAG